MKKILTLFFAMMSSQLICDNISWTSPTTLSTTTVNASNPQIVIDLNGNSTAAWIENGFVIANSQPVGGSWGTRTTISGSTASNLHIAVDGSGNVTAMWEENGVITSSLLPFGGSWAAKTAVSSTGASASQISVDSTGNAVAVWVRNGFIETSTRLAGGSWSVVNMLSSIGAETGPAVAIGSSGTVVAVWHTIFSGSDNIYYSRKTISGGSWSTSATALPGIPGLHQNYPRVTVDANGNATAVWFRFSLNGSSYSNVQVIGSTLSSGLSTWPLPTVISGLGFVDPSTLTLRVQCDGGGNIIAFWTNSYDGYTYAIESAQLPFGGAWSPGGALVLNNLYAFKGDLSVVPYGDAVAAYMYYNGTNATIQTSESCIAGPDLNSWSIPLTPSTGADNGYPKIAASLNGTTINAVCVWLSNNGSFNTVQAIKGNKTIVLPPTSLAINQSSSSYGVFTDYFNTLTWNASATTNIQKYAIYRNGSFVKSVDPGTFTFVDHNQTNGGSVTYGVGAIDTNSSQSTVATINFP